MGALIEIGKHEPSSRPWSLGEVVDSKLMAVTKSGLGHTSCIFVLFFVGPALFTKSTVPTAHITQIAFTLLSKLNSWDKCATEMDF